jgi:glycine/D-amino acid oxidase-like deaminating enzyme
MRVAVLGGGITGVCTALELAERGVMVDLYEQSALLISRASYWNEGKIHLGLVYAQDRSRKTARAMLEGALRFRPLLSRWIETDALDRALSDPFIYAVHRTSLVPPAAVEAHFQAVAELYDSIGSQAGRQYVAPVEGRIWRRNAARATNALFDDDVVASYQSAERSIDAFMVAAHLRAAIAAAPTVTVLAQTTVTRIERPGNTKFVVVSDGGGRTRRQTYTAVVNALWQNRSGIDATLGLTEQRPVLHRFKVGLHSKPAWAPRDLPTVTFLLGEYGDTVNFGHRAYLSWYPACHLLTSAETTPSVQEADILGGDLGRVEAQTLDVLGRLMPGQRRALRRSAGQWDIGGGYITAWGNTGIDDRRSQLHERFEIGVHSSGTYRSIDTGKYCLGPHFADIACGRLVASRSVSRPIQTVKA